MRSIKSGRLRLQVFSIDNKWRAARLAELSLRTSHLVLRTFVGTTNINLPGTGLAEHAGDFTLVDAELHHGGVALLIWHIHICPGINERLE